MMVDLLGWGSSGILIATLSRQIYKQWQAESSEGVSKYLFIGQAAASTGFLIYCWMLSSWVFTVTNLVLLLAAPLGLGILIRQRRTQACQSVAKRLT